MASASPPQRPALQHASTANIIENAFIYAAEHDGRSPTEGADEDGLYEEDRVPLRPLQAANTFQRTLNRKEGIGSTYETFNEDSEHLLTKAGRRMTYNYHDSRKWLFRTGFTRLLVTFIFCALICFTLKAYEGFKKPVLLSNYQVRIFNSIMLGLSLGLGLNLASSLKKYAVTLRWSLLHRRWLTTETFDLILGVETLTKVLRLGVESMPGVRKVPLIRSIPWLKNSQRDGPKYTWVFCMLWLLVNIGAQILVAALSLFWPVDPSDAMPMFTHGNVSISDLTNWKGVPGYNLPNNQSELAAANAYGIQSEDFPEVPLGANMANNYTSNRNNVFKGNGFYEYRFLNRNPDHPYDNVLMSSRVIRVRASCIELSVEGKGLEKIDGTLYANASLDNENWNTYFVGAYVEGGLSYTASRGAFCGPRCTNMTVWQEPNDEDILSPALFLCNSTLEPVSGGKSDFINLSAEDWRHINGTDEFARIGAGAIAWTGFNPNGFTDVQWIPYLGSAGSRWSPPYPATKPEVEDIIARFSIGAVAAFDDHGPSYIIPDQNSRPVQGQCLDVEWPWVLGILGGILAIQLGALVMLLAFANKSIIRDESFLSLAMLLAPVVGRVGEEGMGMSGSEIMNHPKLKGERIQYGYSENKDGLRRVDVLFASEQPKGRRSRAFEGRFAGGFP